MVKRYKEGYPPDGMELVAASDYDALARDLAACKIARDGFTAASDTAHARVRELEAENARLNMEMAAYRQGCTPEDAAAMLSVIDAVCRACSLGAVAAGKNMEASEHEGTGGL